MSTRSVSYSTPASGAPSGSIVITVSGFPPSAAFSASIGSQVDSFVADASGAASHKMTIADLPTYFSIVDSHVLNGSWSDFADRWVQPIAGLTLIIEAL